MSTAVELKPLLVELAVATVRDGLAGMTVFVKTVLNVKAVGKTTGSHSAMLLFNDSG